MKKPESRIITSEQREARVRAIEPLSPYPNAAIPLVSVIVASYNQPQRLELCLESIHRQIYPNWEIIVTDDGSDNPAVETLARRYGAVFITKEHNTEDGRPVKNISSVLNRGVQSSSGPLIQTLQQDHVLAPDFLLWLIRAHAPQSITWGLTDHRNIHFTLPDLASMARTVHLPEPEVRYTQHLSFGRRLLVEMTDWRNTDGLDCAFARSDWVPWDEHPNMVGQSHSWIDWVLQMHCNRACKMLINPMMRLWHMEHEQLPDPEFWQAQLKRSYDYMMQKWTPHIWEAWIRPVLYDVRPYWEERMKEL